MQVFFNLCLVIIVAILSMSHANFALATSAVDSGNMNLCKTTNTSASSKLFLCLNPNQTLTKELS